MSLRGHDERPKHITPDISGGIVPSRSLWTFPSAGGVVLTAFRVPPHSHLRMARVTEKKAKKNGPSISCLSRSTGASGGAKPKRKTLECNNGFIVAQKKMVFSFQEEMREAVNFCREGAYKARAGLTAGKQLGLG